MGNVLGTTDPAGNTTSYEYDKLNRLVKATDPILNSIRYKYDLNSNLVEKTNADHRVIDYVFDALNRQIEEAWETYPTTSPATYTHRIFTDYDAVGQIMGVVEQDTNSAANNRYQYEYDRLGQVIDERMAPGDKTQAATSPISGNVTYGNYVQVGTLASVHTGEWIYVTVTTSGFTPAIKLTRPGGGGFKVFYGTGSTATVIFAADDPAHEGGTWTISIGSTTSTGGTSFSGSYQLNPYVPIPLVEYAYTYYANGSLHTINDGSNDVTTYTYNGNGWMTKVTQSVGGTVNQRADYAYRDDGSISSIYRYANDNPTPTEVAHSIYGYDGMGRLTSLTYTLITAAQIQPHYSYVWDAASRITSIDQNFDSGNPTEYNWLNDSSTITTDNSDQLTNATHTNDALNTYLPAENFNYDSNGNRKNQDGLVYKTGADNHLLSDGVFNYTYDKNGNVKTRTRIDNTYYYTDYYTEYTWDQRNRLTGVVYKDNSMTQTGTVGYTYDYLDRRIRQSAGGSNDYLAWRGDKPVQAFNNSQQLMNIFLIANGQAIADFGFAGAIWLLTDYQGTTKDLLFYNGSDWVVTHRIYESFGDYLSYYQYQISGYNVDTIWGFQGSWNEVQIGMDRMGVRLYNPWTGRFISKDVIPSANYYWAFDNNATIYVDMTGTNAVSAVSLTTGNASNKTWLAVDPDVARVATLAQYQRELDQTYYDFNVRLAQTNREFNASIAQASNTIQNIPSPSNPLDWIQGGLDVAGLVPVLGTGPDLLNTGISALRGDWIGTGMNALAAVPLIGEVSKGSQLTIKGAKAVSKTANVVDITSDASRAASTTVNRFSQLREASTFLRNEAGITDTLTRRQIITSFGDNLRVGTYQGQAYQYSGFGQTTSKYLSTTPVNNPVMELALPPSNPGAIIKQYTVSPTRALMGTVAPQNYGSLKTLPGGAQQIYIPSRSLLSPTKLLPR